MNFDHFAKSWWDPKGPMGPLHSIHPVRMSFFEKHIPNQAINIWDAGCGGGLIALSLAQNKNFTITALDQSADLIEQAKIKAAEQNLNNISFSSGEILDHKAKTPYDAIICSEVLEHVNELNQTLDHFDTQLKPGGILLITTINRTVMSFLGAIVGAEYILGLLPRGTHRYEKLIKPAQIITPYQKMGYTLIDMSGLSYNPLTKKASLCRQVDINYMLALKKAAQ